MSSRRKVEYEVDLEAPSHIENVKVGKAGAPVDRCAALYRHGRKIVVFAATSGQLTKIRRGKGRIRITSRQVDRASTWSCYRDPHLSGARRRR